MNGNYHNHKDDDEDEQDKKPAAVENTNERSTQQQRQRDDKSRMRISPKVSRVSGRHLSPAKLTAVSQEISHNLVEPSASAILSEESLTRKSPLETTQNTPRLDQVMKDTFGQSTTTAKSSTSTTPEKAKMRISPASVSGRYLSPAMLPRDVAQSTQNITIEPQVSDLLPGGATMKPDEVPKKKKNRRGRSHSPKRTPNVTDEQAKHRIVTTNGVGNPILVPSSTLPTTRKPAPSSSTDHAPPPMAKEYSEEEQEMAKLKRQLAGRSRSPKPPTTSETRNKTTTTRIPLDSEKAKGGISPTRGGGTRRVRSTSPMNTGHMPESNRKQPPPTTTNDNDDLAAWKRRAARGNNIPPTKSASTVTPSRTTEVPSDDLDLAAWKRRAARGPSPPPLPNNPNAPLARAPSRNPSIGVSGDLTPPLRDEELAREDAQYEKAALALSLPGAIAMDGEKVSSSAAGSIVIGSMVDDGKKSIVIGDGENESNNNITTPGDIVSARMVDDAEPVFYAKNVEEDDRDWKRKMTIIGFIVLLLVATILTVILVLVLGKEESGDDYQGHPECRPSLLEMNDAKKVLRECFCQGSISPREFSTRQQAVYTRQLSSSTIQTIIQEYGWEENEDVGIHVTSCHPLHQAILTSVLFDDGVVSEGNFQSDEVLLPPEVVGNFVFMVYFYVVMDGFNWLNQGGWFQVVDPCQWEGISCSFVDNFSKLSLANNGLKGNLTETSLWWQLAAPSLSLVDLSRNPGVYGEVPSDLLLNGGALDTMALEELALSGPLPTLVFMDIDNGNENANTTNRPFEVASLNPRMDTLHLYGNQFTGSLPGSWFALRQGQRRGIRLRNLELHDNRLTGRIPSEIGLASDLINLQLATNAFTGTLPSEMRQLSRLEFLDLSNNQFSGTIPDMLGRLQNLNMLSLYQSGFTGAIPDSFCAPTPNNNNNNNNNNNQGGQNNNQGGGNSNNSTMTSSGNRRRIPRRIFVECSTTPLCRCCGYRNETTISVPVRVLCAEELPEFLVKDNK